LKKLFVDGRTYGRTDGRTDGRTGRHFFPLILLGRLFEVDLIINIANLDPHPTAGCCHLFFFFFQSILCLSVAVSTICCHSSRVVAFLQAVARPKFRGPRSASIARSQVWLGLPAGRFQSGGTCQKHAARARWWSSRGELRTIWPKSRRRLLVTR